MELSTPFGRMFARFILRAITLIAFLNVRTTHAQPYIEGGKTRHRFAQLTVGSDFQFFPGILTQTIDTGNNASAQPAHMDSHLQSRLVIGGSHFWGRADFYIAIPLISIRKSGFQTLPETGARFFPRPIEHHRLRPFAGVSLLPVQTDLGDGPRVTRFRFPVSIGAVWNTGPHWLEVSAGADLNPSMNYPVSPLRSMEIVPHWISLSVGYRRMIDTTISAEKDWQSGRTKLLTDTLASLGRLNGFTLSIGPSSAIYTMSSSHANSIAPYAGSHRTTAFIEYGAGYYLHQPDIQLNLSYRRTKNEIRAFDYSEVASRRACMAEAYHFFTDYHGFAAFAGLTANWEMLSVSSVVAQGVRSEGKWNGIRPGITLGWDIRPNRLQAWYLRTHIRYIPFLTVKMPDGASVRLDQLEINFIQLVIFPGRF